MVKVRFLLSVLMMGLLVGGGWIAGIEDVGLRAIFFGLEAVFFLSASLLMSLTFFVLDSEGRIPQNSYAWKYFSGFYKVTEKAEDGKEVEVVKMPASLKLCPAFWMIVGGVAAVAVCVGMLFFLIYLIGHASYSVATGGIHWDPQPFDWHGLASFLASILVVMGTVAAAFGAIIGSLNKNKILNAICYAVAVMVAGVLVFVYVAPADRDIFRESISYAVRYSFFAGLILSAFCVIFFSAIVLLVFGGVSGFKWIKNTIVWKLVLAAYYQLCPALPVEVFQNIPPE